MRVLCPNCNSLDSGVSDEAKSHVCKQCGTLFSIVVADEVTDVLQRIESRLATLSDEKRASPNELRELEELRRELSDLRESSLITMKPPENRMVRLELATSLNEADLEAGIVFGIFTLFAGLMVEQWIDPTSPSVTRILVLITLILIVFVVYTYNKARYRKQTLLKSATDGAQRGRFSPSLEG